jgi:putative 2-oxoglutarate-Fe(II)-dependent oxygenase superfamily protein
MLKTILLDDAPERTQLCSEILGHYLTEPSQRTFNVGGWRSSDTILGDWETPAMLWFRRRLLEAIRTTLEISRLEINKSLRAWAIVNRQGSYHRRHKHDATCSWSGIYYLDPGGWPSARTFLELDDPALPHSDIRIEPVENLVIFFPSSIYHGTEPHTGGHERITLAFDIRG